jgi:glycosyltransferase involved in cell wall biosynthesis
MALGMACVVSPVGVNTTIVEHRKNGFVSDTEEEWENALRELLTHPELRKELGEQAKISIEEMWSVEAWKSEYLELIKD